MTSQHFVVLRWNGHVYDEEYTAVDAVFSNLQHAVDYCAGYEPTDMDSSPIPKNEAFRIEQWEGVRLVETYNFKGQCQS